MIETDMTVPEETSQNAAEPVKSQESDAKIVRLFKSVIVNPEEGNRIDSDIIAYRFYNSFNYSLLPKLENEVSLAIGVTSPNARDGKTLVASNLAVSLAMGYQRETILIDLNIHAPAIHDIFGTVVQPGLIEALGNGSIHVSRTMIDHLHVLSTGDIRHHPLWAQRMNGGRNGRMSREPSVGLEMMAAFRDILYSLKQKFEFIIIDMPSVSSPGFPAFFANQLSGLLVVIQEGKTKRAEIEKVLRRVDERHVLGFVMNHAKDE